MKSGLALAPGSDPESASSFLRRASSWRPGHPVCGPWRSNARNWRWPCPPRQTRQARTPGRPVRAKLGHATTWVRPDSAHFTARRAAFACAISSSNQRAPGWWLTLRDRKWIYSRDRPQETDFISSECGMLSKYPDKSASTTSVCPDLISRSTWRTAFRALRSRR